MKSHEACCSEKDTEEEKWPGRQTIRGGMGGRDLESIGAFLMIVINHLSGGHYGESAKPTSVDIRRVGSRHSQAEKNEDRMLSGAKSLTDLSIRSSAYDVT